MKLTVSDLANIFCTACFLCMWVVPLPAEVLARMELRQALWRSTRSQGTLNQLQNKTHYLFLPCLLTLLSKIFWLYFGSSLKGIWPFLAHQKFVCLKWFPLNSSGKSAAAHTLRAVFSLPPSFYFSVHLYSENNYVFNVISYHRD